ncbi:MAG: 30S ribosomal protein S12 methylthiotransferase RimO [Planctomycetota bacterium]|nr:30S ribosomal protein S12 methylthiotransferase RimO [Planctomycetota bacterium]
MPKLKKSEPAVLSLVNLGCSKNLVDSERILGQLAESGFLIASDPAESELCLVNTCGFIDAAREETAGVLRELSDLKDEGRLKTIVAVGCLVERVADAPELNRFLEHADARLGFRDYPNISKICRDLVEERAGEKYATAARSYATGPKESAAKKKVPKSYNDFLVSPRMRIGSPHSAFLKIAEGCNNPCKFCAIPRMRGLQVSRPVEAVVEEARELIASGAREISLIAQDTTTYGQDLYGKHDLARLLRALSEQIEDDVWFRLMYAYPRHLDAEMLAALLADPRFCPYIDMPLQHIADEMLDAMCRKVTRKQTMDLLDLIAKKMPHGALRTTFIVGYPGETEAHVQEVVDLVNEERFTHAGVFLYSTEPLTPAAKLPDALPLAEKQARRDAIMRAQLEVSRRRQKARVGRKIPVLVDGAVNPASAPKGVASAGRSQLEAPEVDGLIFLKGRGAAGVEPGRRVTAKVVRDLDYDLIAEISAGARGA